MWNMIHTTPNTNWVLKIMCQDKVAKRETTPHTEDLKIRQIAVGEDLTAIESAIEIRALHLHLRQSNPNT